MSCIRIRTLFNCNTTFSCLNGCEIQKSVDLVDITLAGRALDDKALSYNNITELGILEERFFVICIFLLNICIAN